MMKLIGFFDFLGSWFAELSTWQTTLIIIGGILLILFWLVVITGASKWPWRKWAEHVKRFH